MWSTEQLLRMFSQPSLESISLCCCLLGYCYLIINEVSINIYMYIFTFHEYFTTYVGFLTKWVVFVGHYLNFFVLLTVYIICVSCNTDFENWNLGVWCLTMSCNLLSLHEKIIVQYLLPYLSIHPISEQTPYILSFLPNSGENSGKQKLIGVLVRSPIEKKIQKWKDKHSVINVRKETRIWERVNVDMSLFKTSTVHQEHSDVRWGREHSGPRLRRGL